MNQTTPKISGNLTGAAFGASLAMLPIAVIMLLSIFEIFKGGSESFGKAIIILQFIGCLIWAGCIVGVFNNAKKLNVSTGGLALCIPGIIIGGILQIIAVVEPDLIAKFIRFGNGDVDAFFIILLITIVVNLPLAIGTLMVGKNLHALRRASFGYILLSFFPLIMLLIFEIFIKRSYGYYGYSSNTDTAIIITAILLFLLILLCVNGWWCAISNAREIEEDHQEPENYSYTSQPTYIEQPATPSYSQQYSAVPPVPPTPQNYHPAPQPAQQSNGITEAQRNLLMGMSDQELNNVVNNPSLYTNKAFVDEAAKILTKRRAWEMIKDYSDEQLLSIVHDNIQDFAYEVLDAASMELFSREAPAFVNEINALGTEELIGIINNPNAYYDGYVRAATLVLSNRQNNPPQA
ncbi:MAG: hypothetical protein IKL83_00335 [Muribaculaceae bacterium]|nr:hypothetical protein [Muribaculaceae bacterium]